MSSTCTGPVGFLAWYKMLHFSMDVGFASRLPLMFLILSIGEKPDVCVPTLPDFNLLCIFKTKFS